MYYIQSVLELKDFSVWKPLFEGDKKRRKAARIKQLQLFQLPRESNIVHQLYEAEDIKNLWLLMDSES